MTGKQFCLRATLLGLAVATVSSGTSTGQEKTKTVLLPKQVDVQVQEIFATACPCQEEFQASAGTFWKKVWVKLWNNKCGVRMYPVTGKLKVTYYNLFTSSMTTKTINFSLRPNENKTFVVFEGYVLAKKRQGVKATIVLDGGFKDCDSSNNQKTEQECRMPSVY